jgi:hypothetical protein
MHHQFYDITWHNTYKMNKSGIWWGKTNVNTPLHTTMLKKNKVPLLFIVFKISLNITIIIPTKYTL